MMNQLERLTTFTIATRQLQLFNRTISNLCHFFFFCLPIAQNEAKNNNLAIVLRDAYCILCWFGRSAVCIFQFSTIILFYKTNMVLIWYFQWNSICVHYYYCIDEMKKKKKKRRSKKKIISILIAQLGWFIVAIRLWAVHLPVNH